MKTRHFVEALLCILAAFTILKSSPASAADVSLVDKGQTGAAIFVDPAVMKEVDPKKPGQKLWQQVDAASQRLRLQASVHDLAYCIEKMTGAKLEIVEGAPAADEKRLPILIGTVAESKFGEAKGDALLKQTYRVVISPSAIGLYGQSDLASSYAIYELLDRLGCRWFIPSEMGEVVPKRESIVLAESDDTKAPFTAYRGMWYADEDFCRRNRFGGLMIVAGHALEFYMPKDLLAKHPEWVGTYDGKPSTHRLKWSAPGLADALADLIMAVVEKSPDTNSFSLSPDDGLGYDNSAEDKALDTGDFDPSVQDISITDRQVWFCNKIVSRIVEKFPDKVFGMLAYGISTRPPTREKVHPNLIPQVAPITYSRAHPMTDDGEPNNKDFRYLVEGWAKAAPNLSYYLYAFNLAEIAGPQPFITKWSVDLPIIYRNHCKFWQPETVTNFETATHMLWLGNRMALDPNQDPAKIVAELNQMFYGPAGNAMAAYWDYVDHVWVDTPEYSGCGFGHLRRFTPERLVEMRRLMNVAKQAANTPEYAARVGLADDSLMLFEKFMQLRYDQAAGKLANLGTDAQAYDDMVVALCDKYEKQSAFGRMFYNGRSSINVSYFNAFYRRPYEDGARIAKDFTLVGPAIDTWKYEVDKEKAGDTTGRQKADFDDSAWKTTKPCYDTWSALGLHNYMGSMWYRQTVAVPTLPAGKKVFLWISSTDGRAKVFVNGQHVPYVNEKGETVEAFEGYCQPASLDITAALKPGSDNQIAIYGTRTFINELGTGGLLGPVMIYREKD